MTRSERAGKRVLVVDDDDDFRESLQDILASAGFGAEGARTAAEARASMQDLPADVVLVDVRLGREDGTTLVSELRRDHPGAVCVTMTAYAGQEAVVSALRAGAYDYLAKPMESVDLFATLDRAFERVALEREAEEARAALKESEERYREFFEHTSDGIFAADVTPEGRVRYMRTNPALERITGIATEEADGSLVEEILPPDLARITNERYRQVVATGKPATFEGELELRAGKRHYSSTLIPVRDGDGAVRRIIGIIRDTTETRRMEETLREREAFYREVFDNISDGVFVVEVTPDRRYRLLSYNPAQERMVRVRAEDAVGKLTEDYLPAEMARRVVADNDTVVAAGRTMSFDVEVELAVGHAWFQTTLVPVKDAGGTVRRIIGVARDVTERRRWEAALRESEEKFSRAFYGSPDSLVISELEDGTIIEVNRGFLDVYGYTREEVIGHSSLEHDLNLWVYPEERTRLINLLKTQGEARAEELTFRRKDGTHRFGMLSWSIIEIGGRKRLLSITRDVTESKVMDAALRESEARYRFLTENSSDMITRLTPDGVVLYASPASMRILGMRPEELVGRSAFPAAHPDDLAIPLRLRASVESGDAAGTVTYRIQRKDGSWAWVETVARAVRDPQTGALLEIHGSTRDISERKRAEEREREHERELFQAAKLASLGTLVSGIAHEINNPNNYIRLNSQNLLEFWPDVRALLERDDAVAPGVQLRGIPLAEALPVVDNLLRGIEEGSKRIEKLLHNLRDFARGDEGEINESVDLNAVLQSAVMIVQDLLRKSTDSFQVEEERGLPAVRGNYHQVEQVVLNLLTNACQALQSRSQAITARTLRVGDDVALVVSDEGCGIPEEILPRIMDPFFTTRRSRGGSGLGLAVSSRIVQNHGGTMSFQSTVGKGTEVTVRFPVEGGRS